MVGRRTLQLALGKGSGDKPLAASRWAHRSSAQQQKALREFSLHASVADFLDHALIPPCFFTTFPAGWGKLPEKTAGMLYRCGMKRGVPDILIFDIGRVVMIELKVSGRSQSNAQRDMAAQLQAVGIRVHVARSLEEVEDILRVEKLPVRNMLWQNQQIGRKEQRGKIYDGREAPSAVDPEPE